MVLGVIHLFTSWALADEGEQTAKEPKTGARDGGSVRRFMLGESEIRGSIDRPQAIYLIPKMSLELGEVKLEKKFLDDSDEELFQPAEKDGELGLRARSLADILAE